MNKKKPLSPITLNEYHELYPKIEDTNIIIFAGGTDLMIGKNDLPEDAVFLSLSELEELKGIEKKNDTIIIGACMTLNEVLHSTLIKKEVPVLIQAIRTMASEQVRNRATIGGNIGNASPAGDTITPLVVLGASLTIFSPGTAKERTISLPEYFCGPCANTLDNGELITKIIIPVPSKKMKCYFRKVGQRNAMTITKASLSCLAEIDNNKVLDIRLAAGSVSPTVRRLTKTEEFLKHKAIYKATIEEARKILEKEISPITDIRSTKAFRGLLTKNLLGDCLQTIDND
jgi:CO/xanthine dehydrogenase FAD-binding subunit